MNTIPANQARKILEIFDDCALAGTLRLIREQPWLSSFINTYINEKMKADYGPGAANHAYGIVATLYLILDEAQKGTGLVPDSFVAFLNSAEFNKATGDLP